MGLPCTRHQPERRPARLLRNDGGSEDAWIAFKLESQWTNRDGIGARIRLTAGGRTESRTVRSATGYCSQNQLPVVFGLGGATKVEKVEVLWPTGRKQVLGELTLRKTHTVSEPSSH